jgi:hypothetical protein
MKKQKIPDKLDLLLAERSARARQLETMTLSDFYNHCFTLGLEDLYHLLCELTGSHQITAEGVYLLRVRPQYRYRSRDDAKKQQ